MPLLPISHCDVDPGAVNTSRSLDVTSQTATPSLWMVVFDRDLYLEEALQTKHATLINIDANAVVFVNLGALRHVYLDAKPAYEYSRWGTNLSRMNADCSNSRLPVDQSKSRACLQYLTTGPIILAMPCIALLAIPHISAPNNYRTKRNGMDCKLHSNPLTNTILTMTLC